MVGGSLGTYLFPIIFSPLLTRIYTPDEFSVYTIYLTIINVVSIIAALKYELAIPLVNTSKERYDLLRLSIINCILFSLLVYIILSIYINYFVFDQINSNYLFDLQYFVPSGIILTSLFYHIIYNTLLYQKKFNFISISKVVFGFLYATLPIFIFKYYGLKDYKYLIYSHQIALGSGLAIILILSFRQMHSSFFYNILIFRMQDVMAVFKKYKKYPIFSAPSQLLIL